MPNLKKMDFQKAKEEKTILSGLVRQCDQIPQDDGGKVGQLIVDCNGRSVIICEEDVVNFPYARTIASLVGEEIEFVIKEVFPEDEIVYGSMVEAYEIKRKPTMDKLKAGEVLEGVVVYPTAHGAYINVNGVQGFLRNHDFSDDGTEVKQLYPKGSKIKIVFKKFSSKGNLIFGPEEQIHGKAIISKEKIQKGQIYSGKVTGVYPERIYVNIMAGVDVLCHVPRTIADVTVGDMVRVKIQRAFVGDDGKLLVRGECTSRIYDAKMGGDFL